jgi:hypothetical protein
MTPGAQSRDGTPGGGHGERRCHKQTRGDGLRGKLSSAFDCVAGFGIELIFSVIGEAEAGSAGEQPAEE